MDTTKLSSKGQIVIPKWLRQRYNWQPGDELVLTDTGRGVLLELSRSDSFPVTTLDDVMNAIHYTGPALSVEEMDDAVAKAFRSREDDSH
jgi:AbrB family looped-hinge helix DNA binding protein